MFARSVPLKRKSFTQTSKKLKRGGLSVGDVISKKTGTGKLRPVQKKSVLKKKLWKIFSEYIRRKDADKDGMVACYTCGTVKHYKTLHASHFIPKSVTGLSLYFEPMAVKPACYRCNINLSGNWLSFEKHLTQEYGIDAVNELKHRATTIVKDFDYPGQIMVYLEKLAQL